MAASIKPLEERRKQLESDLPKIQAEIDLLKVNNLSTEEIASEIQNLYQNWPNLDPEAKRAVIESITEKIVISRDEISIVLHENPYSSEDMAKRWRRGRDSNPRYRL